MYVWGYLKVAVAAVAEGGSGRARVAVAEGGWLLEVLWVTLLGTVLVVGAEPRVHRPQGPSLHTFAASLIRSGTVSCTSQASRPSACTQRHACK